MLGKREAVSEQPKHNEEESHVSTVTYVIFLSGSNEYVVFKKALFLNPWAKS